MMATSSSLLLVAVLPALFATALGVCDYLACYNIFTLIGTDQEFCNASRLAVDCAERTLVNNPDCAGVAKEIDIVVARGKQIIQWYGCGATALGVCNYMACYDKLTLIGTDQEFCNASRLAVDCAERTLVNNPDCAGVAKEIDTVVARGKQIIQWYGCGATALGVCNYMACYDKFTLIGTEQEFCNASSVAVDCAERNLVNNPDCGDVKKDIDIVVARVKKFTQCYGCGAGNSVSVSFLTLSFGLTLATYFSRSK